MTAIATAVTAAVFDTALVSAGTAEVVVIGTLDVRPRAWPAAVSATKFRSTAIATDAAE